MFMVLLSRCNSASRVHMAHIFKLARQGQHRRGLRIHCGLGYEGRRRLDIEVIEILQNKLSFTRFAL